MHTRSPRVGPFFPRSTSTYFASGGGASRGQVVEVGFPAAAGRCCQVSPDLEDGAGNTLVGRACVECTKSVPPCDHDGPNAAGSAQDDLAFVGADGNSRHAGLTIDETNVDPSVAHQPP